MQTSALPEVVSSRIRLLPRGKIILVIDRLNGRWVMLPRSLEPLTRLIGSESAIDGSSDLRREVEALRVALTDRGIGVSPPQQFDDFNTLILKLTKACNLACTYCYDFEPHDSPRRMDPEIGVASIRQALDLCSGSLQVIFHGGEPMLTWSTIRELVAQGEAWAAQMGKTISFVGQTNLTRLTKEIVEFSSAHHISWGISLDGPAIVNDRARVLHSGAGSHDLFLEKLNQFPEFVRGCAVMTTVTSLNDARLLETAEYFRDLGLPAWDWSLFHPIGRGRSQVDLSFNLERLLRSYRELFEAVESGHFRGFAVYPVLRYLRNFVGGPSSNMCMRSQCGAARDLLSVAHDGKIGACDCIDPTGPLGVIGDLTGGSLEMALDSDVAAAIRSRDVTSQACGDCIWYAVCGGTCLAHAGGLSDVWQDSCAVSLLAFDLISSSIARDNALADYEVSLS